MNVFMEGTIVFTFSTLTNFFIHNGEYTHWWNKWFHLFKVNVFFNSYRWREQMYSRFQRWRFFLFITVNILMEGTNTFHLFNINVFFNSYRWMYSWREQMYSRFQRWRIFLFITVNILMEGTREQMYSRFNVDGFFLFITIYSWREQMVFFNSYRWMYSWREQMYSRFQRWRIFLFITVNILIDGTNIHNGVF